jgi:hypothetical protein
VPRFGRKNPNRGTTIAQRRASTFKISVGGSEMDSHHNLVCHDERPNIRPLGERTSTVTLAICEC